MSTFERAILMRGSGNKAMALYQHFQALDGLPDPSGPLSASVSPAAIKDAKEAVRSATWSKPRGKYATFTPEQQVAIGEYASLHGNQADIRHFSKKLGVEMKVTLVQTWKLARGRGNLQAHTKIKIRKFLLKALRPFIRKSAPPKFSRYTVLILWLLCTE